MLKQVLASALVVFIGAQAEQDLPTVDSAFLNAMPVANPTWAQMAMKPTPQMMPMPSFRPGPQGG